MLLFEHIISVQNICRWFFCKYDDSGNCYTKYIPAMDGTSCGSGKVSSEPCQFPVALRPGHAVALCTVINGGAAKEML